ncbi:MAG TPA: hypothetical protein VFV99_16545 [Kofleriaceae bacterium]|nr:hypothetical protein [Kofleriaceae bacterium]
MTYRSDHEAALARVDALEHELAKLRKPAEKPRPRPKSRFAWFAASIAAAAGVFVGLTPAMCGGTDETQPAELDRLDRTRLVKCVEAVELTPLLTAAETDPHRETPKPITAIVPTAAPCREDLHTIVESSPLSPNERVALSTWVSYEDELAGAIARIETYYASDPYKLDNYTSARQLWVEYDRAHDQRDVAMLTWRRDFAKL